MQQLRSVGDHFFRAHRCSIGGTLLAYTVDILVYFNRPGICKMIEDHICSLCIDAGNDLSRRNTSLNIFQRIEFCKESQHSKRALGAFCNSFLIDIFVKTFCLFAVFFDLGTDILC